MKPVSEMSYRQLIEAYKVAAFNARSAKVGSEEFNHWCREAIRYSNALKEIDKAMPRYYTSDGNHVG